MKTPLLKMWMNFTNFGAFIFVSIIIKIFKLANMLMFTYIPRTYVEDITR